MKNYESQPPRFHKPVKAFTAGLLATALLVGAHRETNKTPTSSTLVVQPVKNVKLNPHIASLENITDDPFAQTTAQTTKQITKKEQWQNAAILMKQNEDGTIVALLAKANAKEPDPFYDKPAEVIELSDDSIAAISVDGDKYPTVNELLDSIISPSPVDYADAVVTYQNQPRQEPIQ